MGGYTPPSESPSGSQRRRGVLAVYPGASGFGDFVAAVERALGNGLLAPGLVTEQLASSLASAVLSNGVSLSLADSAVFSDGDGFFATSLGLEEQLLYLEASIAKHTGELDEMLSSIAQLLVTQALSVAQEEAAVEASYIDVVKQYQVQKAVGARQLAEALLPVVLSPG